MQIGGGLFLILELSVIIPGNVMRDAQDIKRNAKC